MSCTTVSVTEFASFCSTHFCERREPNADASSSDRLLNTDRNLRFDVPTTKLAAILVGTSTIRHTGGVWRACRLLHWRKPSVLTTFPKSARRSGCVRTFLDRATDPHERPLRQEPPSPSRCPRDRDPRGARAQSQERRSGNPARPAGGVHGALGVGQILARLRHHLCRRPAPLRGVALGLCPPVPGDDAEAGRRPDRRPLARHLDRAEDHLAQSALDGRHRHRDLRLYAAAVGARRRALFARDRPADRKPDRVADGRPDHGAAGRHAALSAGAGGARHGRASTARSSPTT